MRTLHHGPVSHPGVCSRMNCLVTLGLEQTEEDGTRGRKMALKQEGGGGSACEGGGVASGVKPLTDHTDSNMSDMFFSVLARLRTRPKMLFSQEKTLISNCSL